MSPRSSSDVTGPASTTPDEPLRTPATRKRKRNVLSCLDCRRRKVKCDHGLPACSKCVLRGVASSCTYDYSVGGDYELDRDSSLTHTEDVPVSKAAPEPLKSEESKALITTQPQAVPISAYLEQKERISDLEDRLQVLEALVARGPSAQSSALSSSSQSHSEIPRQLEVNFFKGRGFRTQFYGASCPNSLLTSVCPCTTLTCCMLMLPVSRNQSDHERGPPRFNIRAASKRAESYRSQIQEKELCFLENA